MPAGAARLGTAARLVHPFPSVLDGLVSAAFALVAGATPADAIRLGMSMTFLQFGIGALNDVVDAPLDAGRKPGKPIPVGLVRPAMATAIVLASWALGVGLAALSGWGMAVLALVVVGIGLAYDLRLKGTPWSWLPFAVGIPILPVYGWLGAAGSLPSLFAVLLPAAVAAGTSLAIGNALIDVERDRSAGITSVAAALGQGRARLVSAGLVSGVAVAAVLSAASTGVAPAALILIAGCAAVSPVAVLATSPADPPRRREVAWVIQAVGLAILGVAWLVLVRT